MTSILSNAPRPSDNTLMAGSSSLYLTQLILTLSTKDNVDWRIIFCQSAIFISLFLAKEFKKKQHITVQNKEIQSDVESPVPPQINREPFMED